MAKITYIILLDDSKSMVYIMDWAITKYNKLISDLKVSVDDVYVTTVLFSRRIKILLDNVRVADVPELRDYEVDDMTAYNDMVYKILDEMTADKYVIISDKIENYSTVKSKAETDAKIATKDVTYVGQT